MDPPAYRSFTVETADAGQRLDVWLSRRMPELSRARVQALLEGGFASLDGAPARPSVRVRAGQIASVSIPPPVAAAPLPEAIPLTILYQDDRLAVVDKPAGLVVHPGAGRPSGTLVNALLGCMEGLSGIGGVLRPGIVHRLDRGTSGLLVVAKDDETHRSLARQFAAREVEKDYLAIVHGVPKRASGTIEAAIGRDATHRKRMSTRAARGRPARSAYDVVEALDGAAVLRVRIHTGRTHQIRVHLASIGHPVAGDATYGGRRAPACRSLRARAAIESLSRPALHAHRLAFRHPSTGEWLRVESPLPADLAELVARLRPSERSESGAR
jgi:23S rRNA pseudouridine1911/1915/1917 synthase